MRINSVRPSITVRTAGTYTQNHVKNNKRDFNNATFIVFTGDDALHNLMHGVSVSVEDNIIGLSMYKCGGQGSVAAQQPQALKKAGMRMPHIVPYYCYNNPKGEIKVLVIPEHYDLNNLPAKMPENLFVSYPPDMPLEQIAKQLNKPVERLKYVVQDAPESVKDPETGNY